MPPLKKNFHIVYFKTKVLKNSKKNLPIFRKKEEINLLNFKIF